MPLGNDFKMSEPLSFSESGKVLDYNPNKSSVVEYNDGSKFPKRVGQTYVDIVIKVTSGKRKGEEFTQENVNTGVYKTKKGKSQMYVFLEMLGVKEEVLSSLANQSIQDFNLMNTVNKDFDGVRETKEGKLYLDLRDPDTIVKKERANGESGIFSGKDEDESDVQTQEEDEAVEPPVVGSSIFSE